MVEESDMPILFEGRDGASYLSVPSAQQGASTEGDLNIVL